MTGQSALSITYADYLTTSTRAMTTALLCQQSRLGFWISRLSLKTPASILKNLMMDTETHHVYSSKFAIHVLDLKQINNASSEDKHWGLDNWAKLFKATTWEDVKMIAANNKYLTEAANTMYELYSDREMRRQMENREDFIRRQKRDQRMLKEQADIIAEKDSALARQADEIARLRAQIETLKKSL